MKAEGVSGVSDKLKGDQTNLIFLKSLLWWDNDFTAQ